MKQGFTLLEVLIATAIASILTVTMFFSYGQLNDSVRKVSDVADIYDAAVLIDQALFKDILGAFIPVQAIPPKKAAKKMVRQAHHAGDVKAHHAGGAGDAKSKDTEKKDEKKKPTEDKEQKEGEESQGGTQTKVPLLKDPFISNNKGENVSMFTFITANPMRVYWNEKTGEPKPSCVRVVYTLQEKKDTSKNRPLYELYRQEGTALELGAYTKAESEFERYLIADRVISCKLTFVVTAEKKEEEKEDKGERAPGDKKPEPSAQKKEKKPELETKEFKDWVVGKDEKDFRAQVKLPTEVCMEIKMSNAADTRDRTFVFRVPVAVKFHEVPEQEPAKSSPAPAAQSQGADTKKPQTAEKERKDAFVEGANKIVQNLRTQFGRA